MYYRKKGCEMGVPKDIREVERPGNTIVCEVGKGTMRYAVRERKGVTYVKGGNPRPVNGKVIGHIVGGKYVPLSKDAEKGIKDVRQVISCGGIELAWSLCQDLMDDLIDVYGGDAVTVLAIALLRTTRPGIPDSRLGEMYLESYVSRLLPGVHLSAPRVSNFLTRLGGNQDLLTKFLSLRVARVAKEDHIAVDGTLKQDISEVNDLSGYSFKSRVKGTKDISIIYAYDVEKKEAVCFDVFPGNMIDATAYRFFIKRNGLTKGIIVDDKGFPASAAKDEFEANPELGFLTPLRRNDRRIKSNHMTEYDSSIRSGGKVITCRMSEIVDGKRWLYSFRDASRAAKEEKDWLSRHSPEEMEKDDFAKEYAEKKDGFGTVVLESNRKLSCSAAYEAYSQRWLIDLTFRQYKQALELDTTKVQHNATVYGTELVNFVSSVISQRMVRKMDDAGLLKTESYGSVMSDLNGVMKVELDGKIFDAAVNPRCVEMMQKLGLRTAPPKPEPKKRGRPKKSE